MSLHETVRPRNLFQHVWINYCITITARPFLILINVDRICRFITECRKLLFHNHMHGSLAFPITRKKTKTEPTGINLEYSFTM